MRGLHMKTALAAAFGFGMTIYCAHAQAGCFNPNDPLAAPTGVTRVVINPKTSFVPDEPKRNVSKQAIELYMASTEPFAALSEPGEGDLAHERLIRVLYIETTPQGKERACREEVWEEPFWDASRSSANPTGATEVAVGARATLAEMERIDARNQKGYGHFPALSSLLRRHFLIHELHAFNYDPDGHLTKDLRLWIYYGETASITYGVQCLTYDKAGRISIVAKSGKQSDCANIERSFESERRYKYIDDQHAWLERETRTYHDQDGAVAQTIENTGTHDRPWFDIVRNDQRKLFKLHGAPGSTPMSPSSIWDLADRNTINANTQYFYYYFPSPPPPLALIDDPSKITQYDRVRVSYVAQESGRNDQINEVITAKGEVLARYYADNTTFRQDVMKDGKLVRVLIMGGQNHIGTKPSTLYYEDPEPLKAFAAKKQTTVPFLLARVYDVQADGKWKLVAARWSRLLPRKKFERQSSIRVGVGGAETVDGSKTWYDENAMLKEYGFDQSMKLAQKFGRPDPSY